MRSCRADSTWGHAALSSCLDMAACGLVALPRHDGMLTRHDASTWGHAALSSGQGLPWCFRRRHAPRRAFASGLVALPRQWGLRSCRASSTWWQAALSHALAWGHAALSSCLDKAARGLFVLPRHGGVRPCRTSMPRLLT